MPDTNDATPESIRDSLLNQASELGFQLHGICPAVSATGFSTLTKWIQRGYAAGMNYFADRLDAYEHPTGVLDGARSIVVLSLPYPKAPPADSELGVGRVARYAWPGVDYHDVIHPKLKQLCRAIDAMVPDASSRGVVDTAPLLEREFAELAGLGWRGKNTLLLNKQHGSYFFLACVLTSVSLPYDQAQETSHCGTCSACLDACPTDAFPKAGILDASRCISYLTIEHRDEIPTQLREQIGDWVFGCDVCQEVCPWNTKPTRREAEQDLKPHPLQSVELAKLFSLTDDDFRQQFRKTPFWRTRRRGILRNAAIVLGNQKDERAVGALKQGLLDSESIVREACQWALERIAANS